VRLEAVFVGDLGKQLAPNASATSIPARMTGAMFLPRLICLPACSLFITKFLDGSAIIERQKESPDR